MTSSQAYDMALEEEQRLRSLGTAEDAWYAMNLPPRKRQGWTEVRLAMVRWLLEHPCHPPDRG